MGSGFGGQERSDPGSNFDRHVFRILLGIVDVMLAIGTTVYHYVGQLAWIDASTLIGCETKPLGGVTTKLPQRGMPRRSRCRSHTR